MRLFWRSEESLFVFRRVLRRVTRRNNWALYFITSVLMRSGISPTGMSVIFLIPSTSIAVIDFVPHVET